MTTFAIAVTIILLALVALLLVGLWAMLSVASDADDRADSYWSALEDLRRSSSSRLVALNGGKSARNGYGGEYVGKSCTKS